jgi:Ca-activated chloride channel homolog
MIVQPAPPAAMTLAAPSGLWWLVAVAALAAAYVVVQLRRPRYQVRFTNLELLDVVAPERPRWRRHLAALAFLAALVALTLAAARPQTEVRVAEELATVVLAIDVSLSMAATDVAPSRLEAAQAAALDFADGVPAEINLGIVAFDGTARVLVAPTTDRDQAQEAIRGLELGPSTAIGEAIFTSLTAIETFAAGAEEPVPAHIVVLTDGATTVGRPNEAAAEAAAAAGVPVSPISFGTPFGEITLDDAPFPVPVPIEPEPMEDVAAITGGTAFVADTLEGLEAVYEEIGSSIGFRTEQQEITHRAVVAALVLFLVAAGFSLAWSPRLP